MTYKWEKCNAKQSTAAGSLVKSCRNETGVDGDKDVLGSTAVGCSSSRSLGTGVKSTRCRISSKSCWQRIGTVIYNQWSNYTKITKGAMQVKRKSNPSSLPPLLHSLLFPFLYFPLSLTSSLPPSPGADPGICERGPVPLQFFPLPSAFPSSSCPTRP